MMSGHSGARSSLRIDVTSDRGPAIRCFANCRFQYDERKMIPLSGLRKGFACAPLLASLTMLSGCITSNDAIFNTSTTPVRSGRYDVQYLVDGQWTNYGVGSLTLVGGKYNWTEDREAASLLDWNRSSLRATLVGIARDYFVIVVAADDLRGPVWIGHYVYGVARRSDKALLYDFPSCLDLLVSLGLSDPQIETIETHECLYSNKDTLTRALIAYAKRTTMRKRLSPSGR